MRKLLIAGLATLSLAATAAPASAQEQAPPGPCAITFQFMEDNGIQFGMYHPLIALAIRTTCGPTG